ncbi:MAG TPA: hypothetical protein VGK89_08790 [Candidatus Eisenbacteria bacterium]|jgi:hypothetical protein
MRRIAAPLAALVLALSPAPGLAQLPVTIDQELFPFPGARESPGSAISAGMALADRWLGEEPFANPAASRPWTLVVAPALLHMSRQDLRADHRNYQETSAFFDAAGGWLGLELGRLGLSLYSYQPVVRLEDNAFQRGPVLNPTGSVKSSSDAREVRSGVALSYGTGPVRAGVAGEWAHRADHYERTEQTGGPASGTYTADFSGDAAGAQAGVRVVLGEGPGAMTVGASLRYLAELEVTGDETIAVATGTTTSPISATRASGWEGGFTASYAVTDAFRWLIAAGGRGAQDWKGFGVRRGQGAEWKLAGEYHDRRDPWTVRFGFGQDQETEVAESRAGTAAVGVGLQLESTRVDFGVVHRSFKRHDHPASSDDRLVLGLTQRF